jgi:hypothetical protein
MAWFRRAKEAPAPSQLPLDINAAIESLLVKGVENQGILFERINKIVADSLQVALDIQQKSRKRLGGELRARSARRERGRFVKNACYLCRDPTFARPTAAMIRAHAEHGPDKEAEPPPEAPATPPVVLN